MGPPNLNLAPKEPRPWRRTGICVAAWGGTALFLLLFLLWMIILGTGETPNIPDWLVILQACAYSLTLGILGLPSSLMLRHCRTDTLRRARLAGVVVGLTLTGWTWVFFCFGQSNWGQPNALLYFGLFLGLQGLVAGGFSGGAWLRTEAAESRRPVVAGLLALALAAGYGFGMGYLAR